MLKVAFARVLRVVRGGLLAAALLPDGAAAQSAIPTELLDRARAELLRTGATGGVLAIVSGDRIAIEAIGHADTTRTTPMRADLLFGTGGLDALYTALVATLLAVEQRVSLAAPVRRYAPDLPAGIGALTLAQLLSHTAGLDDAADEPPRRGRPAPSVWPGATDRALFTEPGRVHSPSRHGLPLARAILASATDQTWDALLRSTLLEPAALERTTPDPVEAESLGAATGLLVNNTSAGPLRLLAPGESPVDQVHSSAGDLARIVRLLLADGMDGARRVWAKEAVDMLERARAVRPSTPPDSVGAGVRITHLHGRRTLSAESGIGGYGTLVRWIPEAGVGVVALGNATGAVLRGTANDALRFALLERGLRVDDEPAADIVVNYGNSADIAGTYANGDRILVLERDGDALYWADGGLRLRIEPRGVWLDVLIDDGRVAETLRTFRDDEGRRYILVGELAYRREP
jgi:CubicO group peptidase (beta-lactamase class C family)